MIDRELWDLLTPDEQYLMLAGLTASERLCDELLASVPACPKHGQCINHAIQWVKRAQGFQDGSGSVASAGWCCQDDAPQTTPEGAGDA